MTYACTRIFASSGVKKRRMRLMLLRKKNEHLTLSETNNYLFIDIVLSKYKHPDVIHILWGLYLLYRHVCLHLTHLGRYEPNVINSVLSMFVHIQ